jgi:hypothetical protein
MAGDFLSEGDQGGVKPMDGSSKPASPSAPPAKRGRGRPRKNPLPVTSAPSVEPLPPEVPAPPPPPKPEAQSGYRRWSWLLRGTPGGRGNG